MYPQSEVFHLEIIHEFHIIPVSNLYLNMVRAYIDCKLFMNFRKSRKGIEYGFVCSNSGIEQNDNLDVEIGSYPFFHAGKLGVSIVIRSEDQNKIDNCNSQILKFVNEKKYIYTYISSSTY